MDWIEISIEKMNQEVYDGEMPNHNKSVYRDVLKKEERYEQWQEAYWDQVSKWAHA